MTRPTMTTVPPPAAEAGKKRGLLLRVAQVALKAGMPVSFFTFAVVYFAVSVAKYDSEV